MAVYQFSALSDGQAITFNPNADVLNFDQANVSAAFVRATAEGANLRISVVTGGVAGKDILLLNVTATQLATTNVTFADGSRLLFGDNTPGTANDNLANNLAGTAGHDLLQGFGGADTLNGGQGNDTYIVGTGDVITDAGGIDTVESDISWTLGAGLENLTLTGSANINGTANDVNNNIIGNSGNNAFSGRGGGDVISGMGGNDIFIMSNGGAADYGVDVLDGGAGVDTLDFGTNARTAVRIDLGRGEASGGGTGGGGWAWLSGIENANGGGFDDHIVGDSAANFFFGWNGNDTLDGREGNDRLEGAAGNDQYLFSVAPGVANADIVVGFVSGVDRIALRPVVYADLGAEGNFVAGDPRFHAAAGASSAHDADDRIIYNSSTGQLWYDGDGIGGGSSQLIATLQGAPALAATDITNTHAGLSLVGSEGDDTLIGTEGNDTLDGRGGNDLIIGDEGGDSLIGGAGNDNLSGGHGKDTLDGGSGNDYLDSDHVGFDYGSQDELLIGGDGNDTLDGGGGADTQDGGLGDDVYYVWFEGNDVLIDSGGIDTVILGDVGAWTLADGFENLDTTTVDDQPHSHVGLMAGNGLDNIIDGSGTDGVRVEGRGGNDTLYGAGGPYDNDLYGGDGNDQLFSDGFRDTLDGGAGNDRLDGGAGSGSTDFVFSVSPGVANADTIVGFGSGDEDTVVLDGSVHLNIGVNGHFTADDARFYAAAGANAAHDASDRVIYNTTTGQLWYDADGTGAGVAQLIATLEGAPSLSATQIEAVNSADSVTGTPGDDSLVGTSGNDSIDGLGGNDTINGNSGSDTLIGGEGNDSLSSGGIPFQGDGGDLLAGGNGDDILNSLTQGSWEAHVDTLDGGLGDDTYYVENSEDVLIDAGGLDTVIAEGGWILADGFENLIVWEGEGGGGFAVGNNAGNEIGIGRRSGAEGRGGNDTMFGGFESTLAGQEGDDVLQVDLGWMDGGAGNDVLTGFSSFATGGAGADRFVLRNGSITDFASGTDTFVLDASHPEFAGAGPSGRFAAGDERFHAAAGATAAHDASDRLIYNTTTGDLYYDEDGTGSEAAQLVFTLQGAPAFAAPDIEVINGTSSGGTINGTEGDDSLTGTSADETINGLGGNDTISGFEGRDVLNGGDGNDSIFGGLDVGNPDAGDRFSGGNGNDTLDSSNSGFAGNDASVDTLDGGLGNDEYVIDNPADVLTDAGGIDTVRAVNMDWTLGAGFENLWLNNDEEEAQATGIGNELNNFMRGGWIVRLEGLGGNDTLVGSSREDVLLGGDGNDLINPDGGSFNDTVDGGAGDDTIAGGSMTGGLGADDFALDHNSISISDFATGADQIRLDGNRLANIGPSGSFAAGDERFYAAADASGAHDASDRVFYNTTTGALGYDPDGTGSASAILLVTLEGAPALAATDILVINGAASGQTITGTNGADSLVGGAGNDTINGLNGHDTLIGGDGDDRLQGGGWSDTMNGGAGNDSFVFSEPAGTANRDTVIGFASGSDELLFENGVLTALGGAGAWAAGDGRFYAAAGATSGHDADDRLVYNTSNGSLYYDADGSGTGAGQIIATFQGNPLIAASDITVI